MYDGCCAHRLVFNQTCAGRCQARFNPSSSATCVICRSVGNAKLATAALFVLLTDCIAFYPTASVQLVQNVQEDRLGREWTERQARIRRVLHSVRQHSAPQERRRVRSARGEPRPLLGDLQLEPQRRPLRSESRPVLGPRRMQAAVRQRAGEPAVEPAHDADHVALLTRTEHQQSVEQRRQRILRPLTARCSAAGARSSSPQ